MLPFLQATKKMTFFVSALFYTRREMAQYWFRSRGRRLPLSGVRPLTTAVRKNTMHEMRSDFPEAGLRSGFPV
jgi:hypothetical protein